MIAHIQGEDFTVWAQNWPAVEVFAACATQWRVGPMGGLLGLDYSAVRAVLSMRGELDQAALFDDVRRLELGALRAFKGKPIDG